jgi:hypothetical protein
MIVKKKTSAPKTRNTKETQPIESLEKQLSELRTTLREVTERFHLRMQAELVTLHDKVATSRPGAKKAWQRFASNSLQELEEMRLRPKRGRLKDLIRIKRAVVEMKQRLPR